MFLNDGSLVYSMNNDFRKNVWNQIEDMLLTDYFGGTQKGIIKEIQEYSKMLEENYNKLTSKSDENEYIRNCLKRDCMTK